MNMETDGLLRNLTNVHSTADQRYQRRTKFLLFCRMHGPLRYVKNTAPRAKRWDLQSMSESCTNTCLEINGANKCAKHSHFVYRMGASFNKSHDYNRGSEIKSFKNRYGGVIIVNSASFLIPYYLEMATVFLGKGKLEDFCRITENFDTIG